MKYGDFGDGDGTVVGKFSNVFFPKHFVCVKKGDVDRDINTNRRHRNDCFVP